MTIDINPGTGRIVQEELRQGHFESVDDLILSGVQAWRERNLSGRPVPAASGTGQKQKAREFVQ